MFFLILYAYPVTFPYLGITIKRTRVQKCFVILEHRELGKIMSVVRSFCSTSYLRLQIGQKFQGLGRRRGVQISVCALTLCLHLTVQEGAEPKARGWLYSPQDRLGIPLWWGAASLPAYAPNWLPRQ